MVLFVVEHTIEESAIKNGVLTKDAVHFPVRDAFEGGPLCL